MHTTTVRVILGRTGLPLGGARVQLGWDGLINLGMSPVAITNADGWAVIEHSATGMATVFVDGRAREERQTPGQIFVRV